MITTYNPTTKLWEYYYETFPTVEGKDVSHVTINLSCINSVTSHSSTYGYTLDFGKKGFKWDDLQARGKANPEFRLYSYNPPVDGVFTVKAGQHVRSWDVQIPSCVPEVSTGLMLVAASFMALIRKRK